jgi:hypothetical protein
MEQHKAEPCVADTSGQRSSEGGERRPHTGTRSSGPEGCRAGVEDEPTGDEADLAGRLVLAWGFEDERKREKWRRYAEEGKQATRVGWDMSCWFL